MAYYRRARCYHNCQLSSPKVTGYQIPKLTTNVGLMWGHRRRRWPHIKTTFVVSFLGRRFSISGLLRKRSLLNFFRFQ